jgi:hypothetical protein
MKTGKHAKSFHLMAPMAWVVLAVGCGGNVSLGSQKHEGGVAGGATGSSAAGADTSVRDAAADAPIAIGGSSGQGGSGMSGSGAKGGTSVAGGAASGGSLASGGSSATGAAGRGGTTAIGGTSVTLDAGVASDGRAGAGRTGGTGGTGGSGGAKDAGSQPADARSGGCSAFTTQATCEAHADCHAVFKDLNACGCSAPGCCMFFSECADGAYANCSGGTVMCEVLPPPCGSQYTVSYTSGCYEGCVKPAVCAPDAGVVVRVYSAGWLAWEAPGGDAGTGPALVASGAGWLDTWNNVLGFVRSTPEKPPSNATGNYTLTRAQADDLFSRLAAVNASVLPHPSSATNEIDPYLYYRMCSDCETVKLSYVVASQLSPEMELVWLWFDQFLGVAEPTNPRNWAKLPASPP